MTLTTSSYFTDKGMATHYNVKNNSTDILMVNDLHLSPALYPISREVKQRKDIFRSLSCCVQIIQASLEGLSFHGNPGKKMHHHHHNHNLLLIGTVDSQSFPPWFKGLAPKKEGTQ